MRNNDIVRQGQARVTCHKQGRATPAGIGRPRGKLQIEKQSPVRHVAPGPLPQWYHNKRPYSDLEGNRPRTTGRPRNRSGVRRRGIRRRRPLDTSRAPRRQAWAERTTRPSGGRTVTGDKSVVAARANSSLARLLDCVCCGIRRSLRSGRPGCDKTVVRKLPNAHAPSIPVDYSMKFRKLFDSFRRFLDPIDNFSPSLPFCSYQTVASSNSRSAAGLRMTGRLTSGAARVREP